MVHEKEVFLMIDQLNSLHTSTVVRPQVHIPSGIYRLHCPNPQAGRRGSFHTCWDAVCLLCPELCCRRFSLTLRQVGRILVGSRLGSLEKQFPKLLKILLHLRLMR